MLVYFKEISVEASPMPIADMNRYCPAAEVLLTSPTSMIQILQHHVDIFVKNTIYAEDERETIERTTRGQRNNLERFQQ